MPIYEFYCAACHMVFNFYSRRINTEAQPLCPHCRRQRLTRQMSPFAVIRGARQDGEEGMPDIDDAKLERAMASLASEAESVDEDDPRQAARLMRRLTEMTGLELGGGMEEALRRMEAGEDPEEVEAELGDIIEEEEPFVFSGKKGPRAAAKPPRRDETLYELD